LETHSFFKKNRLPGFRFLGSDVRKPDIKLLVDGIKLLKLLITTKNYTKDIPRTHLRRVVIARCRL